MNSSEIVIVGGGMVGLSIAHGLTRHGCTSLTVVERGSCGGGSTSKATGGIRVQFSTEVNIRCSLLALEFFRNWGDVFGGSVEYRPVGYVYLADEADIARALKVNVELQQSLGARVAMLDRRDVSRIVPALQADDVVGATLGQDDGIGDPGAAISSLEAACRRAGVSIREHTEVTSVELHDGRIAGVATNRGSIAADIVIDAAGCWAPALAAKVGAALPIEPHHRQAYLTGPISGVPTPSPMVIDLGTGVYFHSSGEGVVFGGGDRGNPPGFDATVRPDEAPRIIEMLARRLRLPDDVELRSMWAGLREMTPDDTGIVGPLPDVDGFWVSAGFSGHGFMHGPAIGELVPRMILGKELPFDVSALSPERFAKAGTQSEKLVN